MTYFNVQEDPWQTILKFMNTYDSSDKLLKVLNEKGEILGERIFIMIDAINEGLRWRCHFTDTEKPLLYASNVPIQASLKHWVNI